jgi:hypothetical protein
MLVGGDVMVDLWSAIDFLQKKEKEEKAGKLYKLRRQH